MLFSNYFSVLNFLEIFKQSIDFVVKMLLTILPEPEHIFIFQNILHLILETKVWLHAVLQAFLITLYGGWYGLSALLLQLEGYVHFSFDFHCCNLSEQSQSWPLQVEISCCGQSVNPAQPLRNLVERWLRVGPTRPLQTVIGSSGGDYVMVISYGRPKSA